MPNDTCTRLDDWVDDDFFGDHTLCDELYLMMIFAWVQGVFPFIAIGGSFCCTKKELVDKKQLLECNFVHDFIRKKENRISICGIGLPSLVSITSAVIYLLLWFDDSRKLFFKSPLAAQVKISKNDFS